MATDTPGNAALVAAVRWDMAELAAGEFHWEGLDPVSFRRTVSGFAEEPDRFRAAAPAEVAALLRVVEEHPGWLEPEVRADFARARDAALGSPARPGSDSSPEVSGGWDRALVLGSRAHAVDEVRRAQDPGLARFRLQVLGALDAAAAASASGGGDVRDEFVRQLEVRDLVTTDPELGVRFERVPPGRLRGVEVQERVPPVLTPPLGPARSPGR